MNRYIQVFTLSMLLPVLKKGGKMYYLAHDPFTANHTTGPGHSFGLCTLPLGACSPDNHACPNSNQCPDDSMCCASLHTRDGYCLLDVVGFTDQIHCCPSVIPCSDDPRVCCQFVAMADENMGEMKVAGFSDAIPRTVS
ncbi:uncharacterized protein LOC143038573 isoform X2 [Oratosquilla oratoria]|uniref:uncharacterized protein LOC143038573 isoform X2 n=1 Tax=Oratosquilla oratoria TaxID=337810 RepID=UPI003F76B2E5